MEKTVIEIGVIKERALSPLLFFILRGDDGMLNVTKEYLEQMDSSMNDKELMLNYVVGNTVMDMGCGTGGLLALLRYRSNKLNLIGMDKVNNTHGELQGMKIQIIEDDILNIRDHVGVGEVDTFIFSSVLHEVFSYNGYQMSKVNDLLKDVISLLPIGGRIIIRDGVMPNHDRAGKSPTRHIKFIDIADFRIAKEFKKHFVSRSIELSTVDYRTVSMNECDAMEFLYTYTWGEEHFEREVKERYGLFQPRDYIDFVMKTCPPLGAELSLVTYNHYLQEGYNYHLSKRIRYTDTEGNIVKLPDSNGIFVFERVK